MFDFNNLITYSFWSLTKTDICLFDVTPREPRGMEMGPRAYSAWMGVRRMCECINSQPARPSDET